MDTTGSLFDDAMESAPLSPQPQSRLAEWDLDVTSGFATMNDEPEPALPTTDGAEEDPDLVAARLAAMAARRHPQFQRAAVPPPPPAAPPVLPPGQIRPMAVLHTAGFPLCAKGCNVTVSASDVLVDTTAGLAHANCPTRSTASLASPAAPESPEEKARRLLAYVDASLNGQEVSGPNPFEHLMAGQNDNEIAAAAANFAATNQRTALKTYDLAERNAIINEGEGTEASNLDRLDISGTHYEALEAAKAKESAVSDDDFDFLAGDPNDMGDGF